MEQGCPTVDSPTAGAGVVGRSLARLKPVPMSKIAAANSNGVFIAAFLFLNRAGPGNCGKVIARLAFVAPAQCKVSAFCNDFARNTLNEEKTALSQDGRPKTSYVGP